MKHIRLLSALTLCALLLTACGGNQNTSAQPNTQTDTGTNTGTNTQTAGTAAAPDTSNDTFSVDLFAGLLGIGKAGLVEQMGTGTELRDSEDNELEGYGYEGILFGQAVTAEVDLNDAGTVDDVDVYFTNFSVDELTAAVNSLPENSSTDPASAYHLECERTPNGSVLEISRD